MRILWQSNRGAFLVLLFVIGFMATLALLSPAERDAVEGGTPDRSAEGVLTPFG